MNTARAFKAYHQHLLDTPAKKDPYYRIVYGDDILFLTNGNRYLAAKGGEVSPWTHMLMTWISPEDYFKGGHHKNEQG